MDKIIITYDKWNMRISTGLLNDWLDNFKKLENIPKDDKGHTFRLNYMIQARVTSSFHLLRQLQKSLQPSLRTLSDEKSGQLIQNGWNSFAFNPTKLQQ